MTMSAVRAPAPPAAPAGPAQPLRDTAYICRVSAFFRSLPGPASGGEAHRSLDDASLRS